MTDDQVKEQLQSAQDLVDSLTDQRNNTMNAMAQLNAIRRAEQRQVESLKAQLQTATNKLAELEERLSKVATPATPDAVAKPNGANGAEAHAAA